MKIEWKNWIPSALLFLVFFALPIEQKYDKVFRYYSLTLIPDGISTNFFEKKIYFYPSDLFALLLFFTGLWRVKEKIFLRGGVFLGIVFLAAVVSIIASPFANYPVAYTRLWQLFTPFALFLFIANGPLDAKRLNRIGACSLFSASILQAFIASVQFLTQRSLGLRILGETPLFAVIPPIPSGRICLIDFFHVALTGRNNFRALGTMTHPNVLGGFCVLATFVTIYLFLQIPKHRIWFAIAYVVQLFALATTFSRAAIYAWCLGTFFYLGWIYLKRNQSIRSIALCVLSSTIFVAVIFHEPYSYRGGIVNYNESTRASDSLRLFYQNIAFSMIKKHPLFGVGYGQFSCRSVPYFKNEADRHLASSGVHNIYLRIASETGFISLLAFFAWIFLILRAGIQASPTLETGCWLAAFLALLFIGLCDQYPIVFQQGALMLFGSAGFLARNGNFHSITYKTTQYI